MDDVIEAVPSADNGNIPVDAPSEPVVEPVAEPVAPPAEPAVPTEPTLYELPDGRKVDGETLAREWKENFLPEFTRKSQELAKIKTPEITNNQQDDPYANPEYVPQSYAEIIKAAEERALQAWENKQKETIERHEALENAVAEQLESLKQIDPSLNENALFIHANKYKFTDLKLAHQNMKDMSELTKTVQQTTAKNIAKRADPVSMTVNQPSGVKINPSQFQNAAEYLRALKGTV